MPIRRINPERPQTSAERVRRWREKHQQPKEPDWGRLKAWLERGNKVPENIPLWGPYTKYVRKLEQRLEEMTKARDFWISKVKLSEARISAEKEERYLARLKEDIARARAELGEVEAAVRADPHYYDRLKAERVRREAERAEENRQLYERLWASAQSSAKPSAKTLVNTTMPMEVWRCLAQWAHPDKHNSSQAAIEAAQWLLANKPSA